MIKQDNEITLKIDSSKFEITESGSLIGKFNIGNLEEILINSMLREKNIEKLQDKIVLLESDLQFEKERKEMLFGIIEKLQSEERKNEKIEEFNTEIEKLRNNNSELKNQICILQQREEEHLMIIEHFKSDITKT